MIHGVAPYLIRIQSNSILSQFIQHSNGINSSSNNQLQYLTTLLLSFDISNRVIFYDQYIRCIPFHCYLYETIRLYLNTIQWNIECIDSHPILVSMNSKVAHKARFNLNFAWFMCQSGNAEHSCISCQDSQHNNLIHLSLFSFCAVDRIRNVSPHFHANYFTHIKFTVRREPPDRFIQLSNWFSNKYRSSNSLLRLVSFHLIPLWLFRWEEWNEHLHFNSNRSIELVQHSIF